MRALLLILAAMASLVLLACGGSNEWTVTASVPVCDYDANCSDEVRCREANGTIEIYLPHGSFSTGNESWSWHEDMSGRCNPAESAPEPASMTAEERACQSETSAAIDKANALGTYNPEPFMSQRCLDLGF